MIPAHSKIGHDMHFGRLVSWYGRKTSKTTSSISTPLKAQVPRARMNPKNPTSREKLPTEIGVLHVSKVEEFGQHRNELLEEEERERTIPIVTFDYGILTQENADTFPILIRRDSRHGLNGSDVL